MGRWDEAEQMLNDGIALDVIGVESTHVRGVLGSLALVARRHGRREVSPPGSRAPRWRGNTGARSTRCHWTESKPSSPSERVVRRTLLRW